MVSLTSSNAKGPACRQQYGAFNYSEGGTPDQYGNYESALRAAADRFNIASVYKIPARTVGGVRAGDNGILPTWGMAQAWKYVGVFRAAFQPSGLPTQTILSQWGETPTRWDGDTPLQMQTSSTRMAPWLRNAPRGNAFNLFSSGTNLAGVAS